MESLDKLRHFLLSDNHFRSITDHRNHIFLFDPTFKEPDFKKETVDKLCRWASKLQGFRYIIEHLSGEDNLWADKLSRWIPNPSILEGIPPGLPFWKYSYVKNSPLPEA
jgi:hypothetical protein